MEHSQSTITAINHQRDKRINFHDHSLLSRQSLKKFSLLSRGYFGSWGHALVAVAVVERFKQEPMYGLSAGTKLNGCFREVAVSGRSTDRDLKTLLR